VAKADYDRRKPDDMTLTHEEYVEEFLARNLPGFVNQCLLDAELYERNNPDALLKRFQNLRTLRESNQSKLLDQLKEALSKLDEGDENAVASAFSLLAPRCLHTVARAPPEVLRDANRQLNAEQEAAEQARAVVAKEGASSPSRHRSSEADSSPIHSRLADSSDGQQDDSNDDHFVEQHPVDDDDDATAAATTEPDAAQSEESPQKAEAADGGELEREEGEVDVEEGEVLERMAGPPATLAETTHALAQSHKWAEQKGLPVPVSLDPECTVFYGLVPLDVTRFALEDALRSVPGCTLHHLSLSGRSDGKGRLAWALLGSREEVERVVATPLSVTNLHGVEASLVGRCNRPSSNDRDRYPPAPKVCPAILSAPERAQLELESARELVARLDESVGLDHQPLLAALSKMGEGGVAPLTQLDVLVAYLRNVHNCCYFCGRSWRTADQMYRSCGLIHLRWNPDLPGDHLRDGGEHSASYLATHQKNLQTELSSVAQRLVRKESEDDEKFTAAKRIAAEEESFFKASSIIEGEKRHRCAQCRKLFGGGAFLEKHLRLRHPELLKECQGLAKHKQMFATFLAHGGGRRLERTGTFGSSVVPRGAGGGRSRGARGAGWPPVVPLPTPPLGLLGAPLMPASGVISGGINFFAPPPGSIPPPVRVASTGRPPRGSDRRSFTSPGFARAHMDPIHVPDPRAATGNSYEDVELPPPSKSFLDTIAPINPDA